MEIPGAQIKDSENFENDQFKHRARQCKSQRENELDSIMMNFKVLEKSPHEKYPSKDEEEKLRREYDEAVPNKRHVGVVHCMHATFSNSEQVTKVFRKLTSTTEVFR